MHAATDEPCVAALASSACIASPWASISTTPEATECTAYRLNSYVLVQHACDDPFLTHGRSQHVGAQVDVVGQERLVLDLSCRRKADGRYYVVTDRWQRFSELAVDESTLADLGATLAMTCAGCVL